MPPWPPREANGETTPAGAAAGAGAGSSLPSLPFAGAGAGFAAGSAAPRATLTSSLFCIRETM